MQRNTRSTLAIYGSEEEYTDRPIEEIADWLKQNSRAEDLQVTIIDGAGHSFRGCENQVVKKLQEWIQS